MDSDNNMPRLFIDSVEIKMSELGGILMYSVAPSLRFVYRLYNKRLPIFGNPIIRALGKNKFECSSIWAESGLPVITQLRPGNTISGTTVAKVMGADVVVAKPNDKSCGDGIVRVSLADVTEKPLILGTPGVLIQEYIECGGKDERYICSFGKIVCGMVRSSTKEGEFRSNLSLGGVGTKIDVSSIDTETRNLVESACLALGSGEDTLVQGVDIIRKAGKPIINETNACPQERIIKICEHNFYSDLAKDIISRLL